MPMDILPPLRRMQIENDIEAMLFAAFQHSIETGKASFFVFERSGIILEVPVVQRNPDNRSARFPEEDNVIFIEEVVEQALEEELRFRGTQHLRHLGTQRVLCAGVAVDEVFHVHPAARAGSSESNLIPLAVGDVTAADAKKFHLAFA